MANEQRTGDSIQGVMHNDRKYHPNCEICRRLPITHFESMGVTTNKETIAEIDQAIESLEAIKEEDRLHHGGILQQWKEIENLINQPLRRNNGRN